MLLHWWRSFGFYAHTYQAGTFRTLPNIALSTVLFYILLKSMFNAVCSPDSWFWNMPLLRANLRSLVDVTPYDGDDTKVHLGPFLYITLSAWSALWTEGRCGARRSRHDGSKLCGAVAYLFTQWYATWLTGGWGTWYTGWVNVLCVWFVWLGFWT